MGKLVKCDYEVLTKRREYTDNHALLKEFMNSETKCMEYVDYPHKSARSCASTLINSAKRYGYYNIGTRTVGTHVYLVRKDLI